MAAATRVRARAQALGIPVTSGRHADGAWMEFLDPDGIALRIVHDAAGPHSFLGVRFGENGERMFYETPLLQPAEADTRLVRILAHVHER